MDGETSVGHSLPNIKASKEPGNIAHELNLNIGTEAIFEGLFDRIGSTEVGKIIDVQADIDRRFAFDESSGVDTRFIGKWFQAETFESIGNVLIPMTRRSA